MLLLSLSFSSTFIHLRGRFLRSTTNEEFVKLYDFESSLEAWEVWKITRPSVDAPTVCEAKRKSDYHHVLSLFEGLGFGRCLYLEFILFLMLHTFTADVLLLSQRCDVACGTL